MNTNDNTQDFDNDMFTITTIGAHGIPVGSVITIDSPDHRWWRRLLFWLFRQGTPMRKQTYRVPYSFDDVPANSLRLIGPYKFNGGKK